MLVCTIFEYDKSAWILNEDNRYYFDEGVKASYWYAYFSGNNNLKGMCNKHDLGKSYHPAVF